MSDELMKIALGAIIGAVLKYLYDQRINDKKALRDYEYEAKKRLYQTYEPLFFQFIELSEIARGRIKGIAKNLSEGRYKGEWESLNNYYFRETIYKIFIPIAIVKLLREKITSTDLRIDENLGCQYGLLKILYFSFQHDYKIARIIKDEKYDKEWKENYRTDNADIDRQGFSLTELDKLLNLLIKENNGVFSIVEIGDYEDMINNNDDAKKERSMQLVEKVFKSFSLESHKIIWILLLSHACIYYILSETKSNQKLSKKIIDYYLNDFFQNKVKDYKVFLINEDDKLYFDGAKEYVRNQIDKRVKFKKKLFI